MKVEGLCGKRRESVGREIRRIMDEYDQNKSYTYMEMS